MIKNSTFKIAGIKFKIEVVDLLGDGDLYGQFSELDSTISIAKRIKYDGVIRDIPENIMLNTFYHELFHCFNYYYNNEMSEELAQTFANFMVEYLNTSTTEIDEIIKNV